MFSLTFICFTGCTPSPQPQSSSAQTAPTSSLAVSSTTSAVAPSSASEAASSSFAGEFEPVASTNWGLFSGTWHHYEYVDAVQHVYLYKIDEVPGEMALGYGVYQTDNGIYFSGPYQLGEDGMITAELTFTTQDEMDTLPKINIQFKAELPADGTNEFARFTLISISSDNMEYQDVFGDILNQAIMYEHY